MPFNMSWFDKNPKLNTTFLQDLSFDAHTWGRQRFAKSFASGGIASTVFASSRSEMLKNPWRQRHAPGSSGYMKRLAHLNKLHPGSKKIETAISAGKKMSGGRLGTRMAGAALGGLFMAMPAFTTEGDAVAKARAVGEGAAAYAGWDVGAFVGARAGAGLGAAIGSFVPVVGSMIGGAIGLAAGALGGGLLAGEATAGIYNATLGAADNLVDRERSRRGLNWAQDTGAFRTASAATMRQQSLSLMNRGQMSARSLMGQEATFVHR